MPPAWWWNPAGTSLRRGAADCSAALAIARALAVVGDPLDTPAQKSASVLQRHRCVTAYPAHPACAKYVDGSAAQGLFNNGLHATWSIFAVATLERVPARNMAQPERSHASTRRVPQCRSAQLPAAATPELAPPRGRVPKRMPGPLAGCAGRKQSASILWIYQFLRGCRFFCQSQSLRGVSLLCDLSCRGMGHERCANRHSSRGCTRHQPSCP